MKAATLKLCLPVIAMTAQQTAANLVIPPFLDSLQYPVSAIGSLISLAPVLALAARLPSGLVYRRERARMLMLAALSVMTLCTFLYSYAVAPLSFALVQALYGFGYGAVTTIYMAFFVEALPADEDRHHAMGYYAGCLAGGYSAGGFAAGFVADKLGYTATFKFASLLGLVCLALLFFLRPAAPKPGEASGKQESAKLVCAALKSILEPKTATIMVVALFLNLLHQMGNSLFPLYGLAVGLSLTQVGSIRALYSLCNAVTRPFSGTVVKRVGHSSLSRAGLPLQSVFLMLVPFFHDFASLLTVFLLAGFLRAVVIVANTISMVEDVDDTRVSRGVISGIYNAAGDIGNILGPSAGGLIASFTGIAHLFLVGPAITVALFFLSLWACRFVGKSVGLRHS